MCPVYTCAFLVDFTWGRLLERKPSKYRRVRLHCGVERSLHARFHGDWPGSFGVINVTDRQTDRQTDIGGSACPFSYKKPMLESSTGKWRDF